MPAMAEPHAGATDTPSPGRLEGKVALITGAARGQGAAEARVFARAGATVVLTDVRDEDGSTAADDIGPPATYLHHDVSSEQAWTDVVDQVLERHGRVDVLVNNAGILLVRSAAETTLADYRRVIEVNQIGAFLGMRTIAEPMVAAQGGSIINISSVAGLTGTPATMAYSASKWAVRGMTKVMARELAPFGIRVNSVHPGVIDTAMIEEFRALDDDALALMTAEVPVGRVGTPEDVADVVLFLASDESSYSTGSEFVVDGGLSL